MLTVPVSISCLFKRWGIDQGVLVGVGVLVGLGVGVGVLAGVAVAPGLGVEVRETVGVGPLGVKVGVDTESCARCSCAV